MEHNLLTDWEEVLDAGISRAGGKSWHLAKLAQCGLPVPDAVILAVGMEQAWLNQAVPDPGQTPSQDRLLQQPLPPAMADQLAGAIEHKGWRRRPLAVRSSATAEDSPQASFAGIHLTRLNVVGLQALLEAVRAVWASRWLPEAIAYRQGIGLTPDAGAMAVLIMPMQSAVASGIAFTCDPLNGRDDQLIIHANWGLGESLVGGHSIGDEARLAIDPQDDRLRLVDYRIGRKEKLCVPINQGTSLIPTPEEQAKRPVLNNHQAVYLGRLLRNAALALDFSNPVYDLEWSWDGEDFQILQARPVTARARNTYPALANQPDIWSRGNTCEVLPDPLSAYDWSASRRLINLMLEQNYKLIHYPTLPGAQRAALINGRLYLNLSLMQWEAYAAFGVTPKAMNSLLGGHQPEIEVAPPGIRDKIATVKRMWHFVLASNRRRRDADKTIREIHAQAVAWRKQALPDSEADLLQRSLQQVRYASSRETLFFLQVSSGGTLSLLVDIIDKHFPGEGHALVAALLAGATPTVTARQAYELAELARNLQQDRIACDWVTKADRSGNWRSELPADNPFRLAFEAFLQRYGHRAVYESYFHQPRWRDAPEYLFDIIRGLLQQDVEGLRQQRLENAQSALRRIRHQLPGWKAPFVASLKKAAVRDGIHREAARSAFVGLMEPQRRILLALGSRWAARRIIDQAEEIFNLTLAEICDAIEGVIDPAGLSARVRERRELLARQQSVKADQVILRHHGDHPSEEAMAEPVVSRGHLFHGTAVGTGKASGIVRILHSPRQGTELKPGEVLVAPTTDPSWTPLFLKARALILETGGYLSHGAIVAREFGIPAVVNLPGILNQLKDGDRVEVDGFLGRVIRTGAR
jgi:pyruvate,water dikinase